LLTALSFILLNLPLSCPIYDPTCVQFPLSWTKQVQTKMALLVIYQSRFSNSLYTASVVYILELEPFFGLSEDSVIDF
jgi:hypothetical protein